MNKVRIFIHNLSNEIYLNDYFRKGLLLLAALLFFATIANISGMLYETRATKGMVFSKDNDAGRGIQTATLTRWWNSNHFAPYGNLYFRVAHTIAKISPSVPPVGYDEKSLKLFLKEAGAEGVKPEEKLTLKKKDVAGKENEVVVLKV